MKLHNLLPDRSLPKEVAFHHFVSFCFIGAFFFRLINWIFSVDPQNTSVELPIAMFCMFLFPICSTAYLLFRVERYRNSQYSTWSYIATIADLKGNERQLGGIFCGNSLSDIGKDVYLLCLGDEYVKGLKVVEVIKTFKSELTSANI